MTDTSHALRRRTIVEAAVGIVMLVLAFAAIASSDVSTAGTHAYWSLLVIAYGVVALVADRLYSGRSLTDMRSALSIVVHWVGVLAAIQVVYFLVASGRMANADTGLTSGLILALGTFTAGAHGTWRLLVIGAALFLATSGVALVEQYVWVLLIIAVLAMLALVLGSRLALRRTHGGSASA